MYPLTAAKAAEDSSDTKGKANSKGSSWAFFYQMPGLILPWLLAYLFTYNSDISTTSRWKLLLSLGCIPSFVAMAAVIYEEDIEKKELLLKEMDNNSSITSSITENHSDRTTVKEQMSTAKLFKLLHEKEILYKIIATGGSWFCYDVVVYGVGLTSGHIIDAISSDFDDISANSNIRNVTTKQMIALSLSIPATISSIMLLPYLGLKRFQIISFLFSALLLVIMAGCFSALQDSNPNGLFAIYCLVTFSLNFGMGITTFSLPAALFSEDIRSTFNGIAAAMGKLGAVFGAYSFLYIAEDTSYAFVLTFCAVIAIFGAIITAIFINQKDLEENSTERISDTFVKRNSQSESHGNSYPNSSESKESIDIQLSEYRTSSAVRNNSVSTVENILQADK